MNEDLPVEDRQTEQEWQAPPLPEEIKKTDEQPQMSEVGTLTNIFIEPGATFEDLRRKPRFVLAFLLSLVAFCSFQYLFFAKVGFEEIGRAQIESNEGLRNLPSEQKNQIIEQQTGTIAKVITYAVLPIAFFVLTLIGGLIYWGGANAMGGNMTFLRGLAVWLYSGLPPIIVSTLANILVLFLKNTDDINLMTGQQGLLQASPAFFIDAKAQPVLAALLGTFDVFFIWGWILAAIGLRLVGKISSGAAWAVVLFCALLNVASRVIGALFQS